jgi:type III secretory pathway component EscS
MTRDQFTLVLIVSLPCVAVVGTIAIVTAAVAQMKRPQ